eukprot:12377774-Heterocapsa_arctica.AAC.1
MKGCVNKSLAQRGHDLQQDLASDAIEEVEEDISVGFTEDRLYEIFADARAVVGESIADYAAWYIDKYPIQSPD